jgi:hypothetical protein
VSGRCREKIDGSGAGRPVVSFADQLAGPFDPAALIDVDAVVWLPA